MSQHSLDFIRGLPEYIQDYLDPGQNHLVLFDTRTSKGVMLKQEITSQWRVALSNLLDAAIYEKYGEIFTEMPREIAKALVKHERPPIDYEPCFREKYDAQVFLASLSKYPGDLAESYTIPLVSPEKLWDTIH